MEDRDIRTGQRLSQGEAQFRTDRHATRPWSRTNKSPAEPRKGVSRPRIQINLTDEKRVYRPGDVLVGQYVIDTPGEQRIHAIEASVIWMTVGKGEEDMGVHFFDRQKGPFEVNHWNLPRKFSTVLPRSPFSYDGMMIRVRWAVRVRLFLEAESEVTEELFFRLGNVDSILGDLSG